MSRTFLYARMSTTEQNPAHQLSEVQAAGFAVDPKRIVSEIVSASIPARERPGFQRLLDRLEDTDVLIVTKLDRLGRNVLDVRQTVDKLAEIGVKVHCLSLGGVDLNSAAGKTTMCVIAAVAEFERDLVVERTSAGLKRAQAEGRPLGRPMALSPAEQAAVRTRLKHGESVSALAREFKTTRQTIMRIRDRGEGVTDAKQDSARKRTSH